MLITLSYRVRREDMKALLGTIVAYPLTEDFKDAWQQLPTRQGQRQPSYSALATGLVAATGRPVRLFGERHLDEKEQKTGSRMLLLTSDTAFDHRLRVAVRAWERHLRDGKTETVLADLLPAPEQARAFEDFVTFRTGQVPVMPGWVFRTAEWQVMRQLAGKPLLVDGRRPVALRMDTDGSLLAWDTADLIVNRTGKAFSMTRVTARLTTQPGVDDPVLCFDAHLSRISPQGVRAKKTWIDREADGAPVLKLPIRRFQDKETGDWHSGLDPAIAKILEACQLSALDIPAELPTVPGTIRPLMAGSRFHALGSGPGPRFMMRLHEHIVRTLPALVPLTYEIDKRIRLAPRVTQYIAGGLPADAVGPTGYERATIACVYGTTEARDRMLAELSELAGHPVHPQPGEPAVPVNDRLDVVACHCPELLAHPTVNRAAHLASLDLPSGTGHLAAAWLETEYHPDAPDPELDAKPHLRRLLGHLGVPAQFLATEPSSLPEETAPRSQTTKKRAARAALRDLLRAAGVLDSRLLTALTATGLPGGGLTRPAWLIGMHIRRQQTGDDGTPLVLTMVALYVDPGDVACCEALVYSDRQSAWVASAQGIADFHSGVIGTTRFGRTEEKADVTRRTVEARLHELRALKSAATPMVIFADTQETRTIWPGLQNVQLRNGPLPADTLVADGADVAIVRMNTDVGEIGRPVTRSEKANMPADPAKPAAPERKVYRLADDSHHRWFFAGRSVSLKAKGGDKGALYTRWTLPVWHAKQLTVPWHSYTAKEIVIVRPGPWPPEQLAGITASLCEQALSWDDRTQLPVPLHFALAIDEDHPDYRVSGEEES